MPDKKFSVGFIGLGIMGAPMSANILKAGFPLTVFNRTAERTLPLIKAGAQAAKTPSDVARRSNVIISCVSDTPDVLEVMLNEKTGVIAGVCEGAIVIDCSTVSPDVAVKCSRSFAEKGASFLDAPVSGGDIGAKAGTLSIMGGGERDAFDRALSVFKAMGKTITYCGKNGAGYIVKLCNQVVGAIHLLAAAEAVCLAQAAGVDAEAMLKAASSGAAGSWMLNNLAPKMLKGDFAPGFFVDYQLKDLRIAADTAHRLKLPLSAAALAETMFRAASDEGYGKEGTQAVYRVIKNLRQT